MPKIKAYEIESGKKRTSARGQNKQNVKCKQSSLGTLKVTTDCAGDKTVQIAVQTAEDLRQDNVDTSLCVFPTRHWETVRATHSLNHFKILTERMQNEKPS